MSKELIERNFSSHKVEGWTKDNIDAVREVAKKFAEQIEHSCPDSRERSIAMTKLEECVFWSTASLAREEE